MTKNNFLSFAVVLFLGLGLAVTANFAHAQQNPGCPEEAKQAADNHADAKIMESRAHASEILPQNDNSPGMTCFDYAVGLTSRLGNIFSDVAPGGTIPVAAEAIFGTSSFPDYGAQSVKLMKGLDAVVNPTMRGHAVNFADSLSFGLGATVLGYMNEFFDSVVGPVLDSMNAAIGTLAGYVGDFNTYYGMLQTALNLLGVSTPAIVQSAVVGINQAWNLINQLVSNLVAAITNVINTIVDTVMDIISNVITSIMGAATPDGDCSRIAQLWGNDFPEGFRSLIGSAVERGTPYFTMIQMLTGAIPDSMGQPGPRLILEIFTENNSNIIQRALDDLLPGGVLSGPGMMPSWPPVPTFLPGATSTEIRGEM